MNSLLTQFSTIDITLITVLLGIITNKAVAIFSEETLSSYTVTFEQVIPLVTPMLSGILTYEQIQCIIANFMLVDGAGVVMDSTHPIDMQMLARLSFSNMMFNSPKDLVLASIKLVDPSTGEYIIHSK